MSFIRCVITFCILCVCFHLISDFICFPTFRNASLLNMFYMFSNAFVVLVYEYIDIEICRCRYLSSKSYGFSSGHVWMWQLDYKESWAPKTWCFWTVVFKKTLESPLDCKGIQPVHPKGNQSWIFIERSNAEAETPILWPPDVKNWLILKDPDAGKDWRWEEKGATEDEMVGWYHWLKWTWVWVNSRSWWWTGKPDMLQSMGSQRVRHGWATELNWTGI